MGLELYHRKRDFERTRITTRDFTIRNMLRRVGREGDLFRPVLDRRQSLVEALKRAETL